MPNSATEAGRARGKSMRTPAAPGVSRLIIEDVRPSVNGGQHPVKRVIDTDVHIEATVYKEGHDLVAARIRYRRPGERTWRTVPMTYDVNLDRCRGAFHVDRLGTWVFTVEAWTDRFETWRQDLGKRVDAGQDVHSELVEGARFVAEAAEHARSASAVKLREAAARLAGAEEPSATRAEAALDPDLARLMAEELPPADLVRYPVEFPVVIDRDRAAFAAWYEMFPRSQSPVPGRHGTFDDAARRLPHLAEMGFDVIYLPPIHPIGRIKRKGANNVLDAGPDDPGSPWAIGSEEGGHTAIDPRLGTFDDFARFVGAAGELGMDVALDYALQCAPDHPWVREHPEWFFVRPDGTIKYAENPPKKYEDIYPLNFWCARYEDLWAACRDILLFWIERGVRTFRVDNPHTKPYAFWAWVIAEVKRAHPDVIFLAEAFTRPARMLGLAKLGFTQSYTYFTWRNTAWELREYLTELTQTDRPEFFRPHLFANTPDILHEYLQQGGRAAFRVRLILAGTLSPLYGIYSGFELCENVPIRRGSEEYLHSEKYEIVRRDWNTPGNLNADITRLNRVRRENPALQRLANLRFYHSENDRTLFYHKHAPGNDLLIVVNLDPHRAQETNVHVPLHTLGLAPDVPFHVIDLLTGARYTWRGESNYVRLDPLDRVAHILRVERPAETTAP
jgi:starch synthase (maltosyl-transferring)